MRPNERSYTKSIAQAVKGNFSRNKQTRLWSVSLNDSKALFKGSLKEVPRGLYEIVELKLTQQVEISANDNTEKIKTKMLLPILGVFQFSKKVCDRQLAKPSNLSALTRSNKHFFVCSVFLQGLLLRVPDTLLKKVESASSKLKESQEFCKKLKKTTLELCFGYANFLVRSLGLIFGVNSEWNTSGAPKAFNPSIDLNYSKVPKIDDWLFNLKNWS